MTLSHTNRFVAWTTYRTILLPLLILGAMMSMLFSGVLGLVPETGGVEPPQAIAGDHDNTGEASDPAGHSDSHAATSVTVSVAVGAALMLLHAAYLSLMAYHLVYRFPVERVQPIAAVYVLIAFAYVAHAVHGRGIAPWWSGAAFALAYVGLWLHGRHPEEGRRVSERRAQWMRHTDLGLFAVALLLVARELDLAPDWVAFVRTAGEPVFGTSQVFEALLHQTTPKDAFVAVALLTYAVAWSALYKKLRSQRRDKREAIETIQTFEAQSQDLDALRSALPQDGRWLDLWSGRGTQLAELARVIFAADLAQLQQAERAHAARRAAEPEAPYVPPPTKWPKRVVLIDEFGSAGVPRPDDWPQALEWDTRSLRETAGSWHDVFTAVDVVHLSHFAYDADRVTTAVGILKHARQGTTLLLRFTSNTSFYRAISAAASCAPFRPYTHHHMHALLISDLATFGWERRSDVPDRLLGRRCRIDREGRRLTAAWVEAQYGEFSADVLDRYLSGLASDQEIAAPGQQAMADNFDRLVLLRKVR